MLLKTAAILALSLVIAFLALVLVVEGLKQRQKDLRQVSPLIGAEDDNRKTLEAADAMRSKQAERFLQHQR